MKKMIVLVGLFGLVALATGCNSLGRRIQRNQAVFDTYPADAQAKIRAGKIDIGFNRTMVEIAVGRPDRVYVRTKGGMQTEVWRYIDHGPTFSVGIGFGFGHSHHHHGGHMGFSTILVDGDRYRRDERMRVEFDGDKVIAFEEVKRRR